MPPFHACILGDVSGRGSRGVLEPDSIARRPIVPVDRDVIDGLPARLGVELALGGAGDAALSLAISDPDDFRPERLVETLPPFAALRALRRRLQDPATFAAAAAEMADWAAAARPAEAPAAPTAPAAGGAPSEPAARPEAGDLLAASIAATEEQGIGPIGDSPQALADRLIARAIAPHLEPAPDPRRAECLAAVDAATAGILRGILHDPAFRQAEAAWRGLDLLARRLETGPDLKLFLVDVTRAELAADLARADDPRDTGLYRLLVEPTVDTPGGVPWGLWIGDFAVGPETADIAVLHRLGQLAARAGAPLVLEAKPGLVGAADFAASPDPDDWGAAMDGATRDAWEALRGAPEAGRLALAMPRWLARLPYGRDSDPVEGFDFEEIENAGRLGPAALRRSLLWANPGFLVGLALAAAYREEGWRMRPDRSADVDSLPFYVYKADGESAAVPCAEILLTERGGARLADRGLTPLWSVKNADRVRVGPVRSLSDASPRLAGRWAG
jgi:type VI secretion system protein ImpC